MKIISKSLLWSSAFSLVLPQTAFASLSSAYASLVDTSQNQAFESEPAQFLKLAAVHFITNDGGLKFGGGNPGGGGGFPGGSFGGPGGESGTLQEGDSIPAMGGNDSGGDRQPPESMGMPGGFPGRDGNAPQGGGFPGEMSAGIDVTALVLVGISVLALLAGLLVAFQFKRPGGVRYGKTHDGRRAGPVSADPVRERHSAGRRT